MQRYGLSWCGPAWPESSEMCEDADGDYVLWSDAEQLRAERDQLRARVAELSAPPVVPEGWRVVRRRFVRDHWEICSPGDDVGRWFLMHLVHADKLIVAEQDSDGICTLWHVPNVPWPALRALAWAIEHDQRPPHAGDEP